MPDEGCRVRSRWEIGGTVVNSSWLSVVFQRFLCDVGMVAGDKKHFLLLLRS